MMTLITLQHFITLREQLEYRVNLALQHEDEIEEVFVRELLDLCNRKIDYIINYKEKEDYTNGID